jgi:aryl-alcohol dehydrogenase-like predicted oxidoreductase
LSTWAPENLHRNLAVVEKLRALAERQGKTVAQLAVAWVLAHPAVSVALCGARTPREILDDIGGDWEMEASLRREIDEMVLKEGAGIGRAGDPLP